MIHTISLSEIHDDPRNSNVVPEETLQKLQRNIKRTGHYPPLIVRPRRPNGAAGEVEGYQLLDGHHRKIVLERLKHTDATCDVWDITDREAEIALASLNTLRGAEDPRKRSELLHSLLQSMSVEQLAQAIPESAPQIEDAERLFQVDLDALETEQRSAASAAQDQMPQPLHFILAPDWYVVVKNALESVKTSEELHGKKNADGHALYLICADFMAGAELHAEAEADPANGIPIGSGGASTEVASRRRKDTPAA